MLAPRRTSCVGVIASLSALLLWVAKVSNGRLLVPLSREFPPLRTTSVLRGSPADHASFEAARAGCIWNEIPILMAPNMVMTSTQRGSGIFLGYRDILQGFNSSNSNYATQSLRSCEAVSGSQTWAFTSLGPYVSDGGMPESLWHSGNIANAFNLESKIRSVGHIWVTAASTRVRDSETDDPYGSPPFHQHHAHVSIDSADHDLNTDRSLYFNGPDSGACTRMEGGELCNLEVYPEGYGWRVNTSLFSWFTIDDMRKHPSRTLSFRFEATVRYAVGGQQRLALSRWWAYGPFSPAVKLR
jgi:hypothetical protein